MTLTSSYQYIARSTSMPASNGANYYVLMYAKATPDMAAGTQTVSLRMYLACTENSSFYDQKTGYQLKFPSHSLVYNGTNKPNGAWSTEPLTAGGVTYKKWIIVDSKSLVIDRSSGQTQVVPLSMTFTYTDSVVESYTPATGASKTVTAEVTVTGLQYVRVNSVSNATGYLDDTITCEYFIYSGSYYIRRIVGIVNGGDIRVADLGKKSSGQQTSVINFTAAELSAIYAKATEATNVQVYISFQAFADSEYSSPRGLKQVKYIILKIPESIKPSASLSIVPTTTLDWLKDQELYVTNSISNAQITLTASPGEGASLSSTSITTSNNETYNTKKITAILSDPGKFTFTGKAVDSRGRSATAQKTITVLAYGSPTISTFRAERGTYASGWTASDTGPDVRVVFKTTLSLADNGNNYTADFKLDKVEASPDYGATTGLLSGASRAVYFCGVDGEKSHSIQLAVTDRVGSTTATTITIPTNGVTIEYNASGKGIAFGKASEKEAFECAWPTYLNDDLFLKTKITCTNPYNLRNFNINCYWADNAAHDMIVRNNDGLTLGLGWTGNAEDGTSYETVLDVRPKRANFRGDIYSKDIRIPETQHGTATITPSAANTPTSLDITFNKAFSGVPTVIVTPRTSVPGTTVLGVGVSAVTATGCKIWVTRTNVTDTIVNWIATY